MNHQGCKTFKISFSITRPCRSIYRVLKFYNFSQKYLDVQEFGSFANFKEEITILVDALTNGAWAFVPQKTAINAFRLLTAK